jgi:hypothetical protein
MTYDPDGYDPFIFTNHALQGGQAVTADLPISSGKLFFQYRKFNPTVVSASIVGIIGINRFSFTIPMGCKPKALDTLTGEIVNNGLRTTLRQV